MSALNVIKYLVAAGIMAAWYIYDRRTYREPPLCERCRHCIAVTARRNLGQFRYKCDWNCPVGAHDHPPRICWAFAEREDENEDRD